MANTLSQDSLLLWVIIFISGLKTSLPFNFGVWLIGWLIGLWNGSELWGNLEGPEKHAFNFLIQHNDNIYQSLRKKRCLLMKKHWIKEGRQYYEVEGHPNPFDEDCSKGKAVNKFWETISALFSKGHRAPRFPWLIDENSLHVEKLMIKRDSVDWSFGWVLHWEGLLSVVTDNYRQLPTTLPVSESFWSNLKLLGVMDLTAWLWGWNVFSLCDVCSADSRSFCWVRWWPPWTTETRKPRFSKKNGM